ncbi:acylneuraminate cytidylyltransferase family protein [uncultured Desulfobacter sp.]|uniref:acylneuraminate cytidylyltransferase family protein n=1 Tax=uncultured Desulfobacter sp. TaxID=240139 RepID=UPI002AA6C774|nr:acylneuraminate cytidylyltransferase family protein [uncultured Desulfobacter sp.]
MTTNKIVALLPIKANSQRVKGKNFKPLHGKPLFRWILDTLLAIEDVDRVVINTDAREILAGNGLTDSDRVMIRDRKPELCGDNVSMNLILADDVAGLDADCYLMTHATNPFLSTDTILEGLRMFKEKIQTGEADSVFTVNKIQTRFYREDCSAVNHDPDNLIQTQDLEPWYEENSNLYLFTKESFTATNARIGKKPAMLISPKFESIDIDEPEDWEFAQIAAQYFDGRKM